MGNVMRSRKRSRTPPVASRTARPASIRSSVDTRLASVRSKKLPPAGANPTPNRSAGSLSIPRPARYSPAAAPSGDPPRRRGSAATALAVAPVSGARLPGADPQCLVPPPAARGCAGPGEGVGRRPRLQEPPLGKEESLVGTQREAVGHPRDVVGDAGGVVAGSAGVLLRDLARVLEVVGEQGADDLDGLLLLGPGLRPQVDTVEHELAQLVQ